MTLNNSMTKLPTEICRPRYRSIGILVSTVKNANNAFNLWRKLTTLQSYELVEVMD